MTWFNLLYHHHNHYRCHRLQNEYMVVASETGNITVDGVDEDYKKKRKPSTFPTNRMAMDGIWNVEKNKKQDEY